MSIWGTRWRSWLRHCATSRKVAGAILDGVTSGRTMALGCLTEMSTRKLACGVKAASGYGWKPCHLHVPIVLKFQEPQPPGALRACRGLLWDSFTFTLHICNIFKKTKKENPSNDKNTVYDNKILEVVLNREIR